MSDVHKAEEIADAKKEVVTKIVALLKKYPIIGAVNFENLPAAQLQNMKSQLRDKVVMLMTKRRLMKIAIEQVKSEKKGIENLEPYLKGMPALLFTEENPFSLFKTIKKNKSKAPAKAGQIAPSDIIVNAGPTSFAPGPVISELGSLGIKSKVENGKIAIISDTVVCKEGEEISAGLAGMLTRLGIKPMEVGLDITAVYEKGEIFTKSVLDIDEDKFMADLSQASLWAFNLSCETAFVTEMNKEMLIQKAFRDAKALALSENILADAVVEEILAKAERQMLSVKSQIPDLPAKAEVKEEPKAEEKKEEAKPEETVTKKPVEEVKKEVKKEAPKAEEKVEEKKEEPVKEEPKSKSKDNNPKDETEKKVDNIVKQTKAKEENKISAEALVEEAKNETETPEKKELDEQVDKEKVEDLTAELLKKGTLRK